MKSGLRRRNVRPQQRFGVRRRHRTGISENDFFNLPLRSLSSLRFCRVCGDTAVCRSGSLPSGKHPSFEQKGYRRRFRAVQSRSEIRFSTSSRQSAKNFGPKTVALHIDRRPEILYNVPGILAHHTGSKQPLCRSMEARVLASLPPPPKEEVHTFRNHRLTGGLVLVCLHYSLNFG